MPDATDKDKNDDTDQPPIRIKMITLGDMRVGKSATVKKYCEPNRFASKYLSTIGVDYGVKATSKKILGDGQQLNIKIDFFDLSGNPDYSEVRKEQQDYAILSSSSP